MSYPTHLLKYFYVSLLIIFGIFTTNLLNAKDTALDYANYFCEVGNYENAITEYKRFIYFNPNDEKVSETYYNIGLACRKSGNWEKALDAFSKSSVTANSDSLHDERRITIATTQIAKGSYSLAEFELLKISLFSKYHAVKRKAYFFLGVCNIYTNKWSEANKSFRQYFSASKFDNMNKIDSVLTQAENQKYKSPRLAKWISTFLPGFGQIYAGDWLNGINALIVNGLTTYLLFDALVNQRYEDVLITNITLFERYYRGNRYNAEKIAELHNKKISQKYAQEILELLQEYVKKLHE